jgi:hypothetical protein
MKKILLLIISSTYIIVQANEALFTLTKQTGVNIYNSCIINPPSNPQQEATCSSMYEVYNSQLTMLNAPLELKISKDISPYASSPYDICKYEPAHLIFSKEQEVPYCLSNIF